MVGIDIAAERERVASAIRDVIPDKWTVYAAPRPSVSLPAVIIRAGRGDYLRRVTANGWEVSLDVEIVQGVAAGEVAYDILDAGLALIMPKLLTVEEIAANTVSTVDTMRTEGGAPVVVASIPIVI
jgi:hypothetical protein